MLLKEFGQIRSFGNAVIVEIGEDYYGLRTAIF